MTEFFAHLVAEQDLTKAKSSHLSTVSLSLTTFKKMKELN